MMASLNASLCSLLMEKTVINKYPKGKLIQTLYAIDYQYRVHVVKQNKEVAKIHHDYLQKLETYASQYIIDFDRGLDVTLINF